MVLEIKRPLICIDTETTGVDVEHDRVVQLAVIQLDPDGSQYTYCRSINPQPVIIPEAAIAVHGITNDDVLDEYTFEELAVSLQTLLSGADITGYNVSAFDVPILKAEFARCGIVWPDPGVKIVDSFEILKRQEPRTLSNALTFYTGCTIENAHDAAADTKAALDVLLAQASRYSACTLETLAGLARDPNWIDSTGKAKWVGDIATINFGKWKGHALSEVDHGYLNWILYSDFPEDFKALCKDAKRGRSLQRAESTIAGDSP